MKSRIELHMTVARRLEAIGTVDDARAARSDDAHFVTQLGVLSRRKVAGVRGAAAALVAPARGGRGHSSRSSIHYAGAGDPPCSNQRGQA